MNIGFNLLNKSIFKYFPFPWTVSTVHVVIGLIYCVAVYALGFKGASFGRVSVKRTRTHTHTGTHTETHTGTHTHHAHTNIHTYTTQPHTYKGTHNPHTHLRR
jgi:hypothetical protein